MSILNVDRLIDDIINKLNVFLVKEDLFDKIINYEKFAINQKIIIQLVNKYTDTITSYDGVTDVDNYLKKNITKYCIFYIYLGIIYNFTHSKNLFISNIIQIFNNLDDNVIDVDNFYNSSTASSIIKIYDIIKDILLFVKIRDIVKINILIKSNPDKYRQSNLLFIELGEEFFNKYFNIEDNFHNIVKTVLFKNIYENEKNNIFNYLNNTTNILDTDFKYIDIIVSTNNLLELYNIQKALQYIKLPNITEDEIYDYLNDSGKEQILTNYVYLDFLFNNKIIVPITQEFLKYHSDDIQYDSNKNTDTTEFKKIISTMIKIKNMDFYEAIKNNNFLTDVDKKMGFLYNNEFEKNVINKLINDNNLNDLTLLEKHLSDKYAYVNFKDIPKSGINYRANKTIQCIREISLYDKTGTELYYRIGNNNIDINISGICIIPLNNRFDLLNKSNLINVSEVTNNPNGYSSFKKLFNNKFGNTKKIYYWIYDNKKDIIKTTTYNNVNNIINISHELYDIYLNKINNILFKKIEHCKDINTFNKIIKDYKNIIIENNKSNVYINTLYKKFINVYSSIIYKSINIDNKLSLKLPVIKNDTNNTINKITLTKKIDNDIIINNNNNGICNHYFLWSEIKNSSLKSTYLNQMIFNFVKKYVKSDNIDEYVCKSCGELLKLKKYVVDGLFVDELDKYLTTELIVHNELEDIPQYSFYKRTIFNIRKIIEKILFSSNLESMISSDNMIKKELIKNIIDTILIHTNWQRLNSKEEISRNRLLYGIDENITNIFPFDLSDNIFLPDNDNDKLKPIKFNNIIIYILFWNILEISEYHITNLGFDKNYNVIVFQKINSILFNKLKIKLNKIDNIPLVNIPVLSYLLYYFSGMVINSNLWITNKLRDDKENTVDKNIKLQKSIIHSFVDLYNNIVDGSLDNPDNMIYEILRVKMIDKLRKIFINNTIFDNIKNKIEQNTKIINNNITKIDIPSEYIDINKKDNQYYILTNKSINTSTELIKKKYINKDYTLSNTTNCKNGDFHKWTYKENYLICLKCLLKYNDINNIKSIKEIDFIKKTNRFTTIETLSKYCNSTFHKKYYDINDICKNIINSNILDKELDIFNKKINSKNNELLSLTNKNIIENTDKQHKYNKKIKKLYNKWKDLYTSVINNRVDLYIDKFIDIIEKISGDKINIDKRYIYLKKTYYTINHDYLGNNISENIILFSDRFKITENDKLFNNLNTINYENTKNNIIVYYNLTTLQYIGYIKNKQVCQSKNSNNAKLIEELSFKDILLLLGSNSKYFRKTEDISNSHNIINAIKKKSDNLKIIINSINNIFVKTNANSNNTIYKDLKIKKLKLIDSDIKIFNHVNKIINNIKIKKNISSDNVKIYDNYIDISKLYEYNSSDCKLLFYLIYNLQQLIDINNTDTSKIDIIKLIMSMIVNMFYMYYIPNYLIIETLLKYSKSRDVTSNVDLKVTGIYNELSTAEEINDLKNINNDEKNQYDLGRLEIDDYEQNDDIDYAAEALDGYE